MKQWAENKLGGLVEYKGRGPTTVVLLFIVCYTSTTICLVLLFDSLLLSNKSFHQLWVQKNQKHMFSEKLGAELLFLEKVDVDWSTKWLNKMTSLNEKQKTEITESQSVTKFSIYKKAVYDYNNLVCTVAESRFSYHSISMMFQQIKWLLCSSSILRLLVHLWKVKDNHWLH